MSSSSELAASGAGGTASGLFAPSPLLTRSGDANVRLSCSLTLVDANEPLRSIITWEKSFRLTAAGGGGEAGSDSGGGLDGDNVHVMVSWPAGTVMRLPPGSVAAAVELPSLASAASSSGKRFPMSTSVTASAFRRSPWPVARPAFEVAGARVHEDRVRPTRAPLQAAGAVAAAPVPVASVFIHMLPVGRSLPPLHPRYMVTEKELDEALMKEIVKSDAHWAEVKEGALSFFARQSAERRLAEEGKAAEAAEREAAVAARREAASEAAAPAPAFRARMRAMMEPKLRTSVDAPKPSVAWPPHLLQRKESLSAAAANKGAFVQAGEGALDGEGGSGGADSVASVVPIVVAAAGAAAHTSALDPAAVPAASPAPANAATPATATVRALMDVRALTEARSIPIPPS